MRSFAEVCESVVSTVLDECAPEAAEHRRGERLHLAVARDEGAPHAGSCADTACRVPGQICLDLCGDNFEIQLPGQVLDVEAFEALREAQNNPLELCDFARTGTGVRLGTKGRSTARAQPSAAVGDYLAVLSQSEATSVASFADLAGELRDHGAPAELVERARIAQDEERVHVVLVGRLAMRHGATPTTAPRRRRAKARSLAALACRNAAEGCGSEAFNAVVITWSARTARDLSMRSLARHLAADEARHADLANDVHAWAIEHLPPRKVARLREIRDTAIRSAAREATPTAVQTALGVPSAAVASRLAEELIAELGRP